MSSIPPEYSYLADPRLATDWCPFILLVLPLNIQVDLPCTIGKNFQLRKLNDLEIRSIRVLLRQHSGSDFIGGAFETKYSASKEGGGNSSHKHLEDADRRYFGLWSQCQNESLSLKRVNEELYKPSLMMGTEFFAPIIKDSPNMTSWGPYDLTSILRLGGTPHHKFEHPIDVQYLEELGGLSSKVADNQNHEFTYALNIYADLLHKVNSSHRLYLLGLYVILESLVTHNPEARTTHSLAHQIEYKMPLIVKRLYRPPDVGLFSSEEKLWEKLYKLRNVIAHGGKLPDDGKFTQSVSKTIDKLVPLKSISDVRIFLEQTVRGVLRFALEEPELQQDLRLV